MKTILIICLFLLILPTIIALIVIVWILKGQNGEDKFYKELNEMDNENRD